MDNKKSIFDAHPNYMLTSKQACRLLNIKLQTLYNMVHEGRLKALKLGEGKKARLRFAKSELDKYLGK